MVRRRKQDRSLFEVLLPDSDKLWPDWLKRIDTLLEDEAVIDTVGDALERRWPQSKKRGREGTPAEVVLRMLILKHLHDWSFDELEQEVRANLVYRAFTRIGVDAVPDAKTILKIAKALGPDVITDLHQRVVDVAKRAGVTHGRRFIQEAEHQIVTAFDVHAQRPADAHLWTPALDRHQQIFGRAPDLATGDKGFSSAANERAAADRGVRRVVLPARGRRSATRRAHEHQRWFRRGQRWRTGCEGRISVLKRRHGMRRCRYRGSAGIHRWVGLAVIADNLINVATYLDRRAAA
jgi:hypothetical protein